MKSEVKYINGIPVEAPVLNEELEQERARLCKIAAQEYDDNGTLASNKLLEANAQFLETVKNHILSDGENQEPKDS